MIWKIKGIFRKISFNRKYRKWEKNSTLFCLLFDISMHLKKRYRQMSEEEQKNSVEGKEIMKFCTEIDKLMNDILKSEPRYIIA